MRSFILYGISKCLLLTMLLLAAFLPQSKAQDFVIGTGTTTNTATGFPCPLQDVYVGARSQYLYLASELTTAGMQEGSISAIKFTATALNNAPNLVEGLVIKIGHTKATGLVTTAWESVTDIVETAPVNYVPVVGVNSFALPVPFIWNGVDNIMIEICNGTTGGAITRNAQFAYTTTTFFSSHLVNTSAGNGCNLPSTTATSTSRNRTNVTLTWAALTPCAGTPNAGAAVTTTTSTCGNAPFTVKLSGATVAGKLSYQWQSSTNNSTWTNIPGATGASLTTTQLRSTYYRAVVTCTNTGGGSASSASVLVNAAPLVTGNFTIDNSVPASTGTTFKTFMDAYNSLKCGIGGPIVFNVVKNATPYTEQLIMEEIPGASAVNTVTFKGNGATLSFLSANTDERAVVKFNGADHIIIDSLNITALANTTSNYGYGVHMINNADSNEIRKCKITVDAVLTSTFFNGIVISGGAGPTTTGSLSDGNIIDRNTIIGGVYGISIVGADVAAIQNNKITNNKIQDFYQYGVFVNYTAFTLVEGNDITRPNRVLSPTPVQAITLSGTNLATLISRNRIHSVFDAHLNNTGAFYGIYLTNSDADFGYENIISNNIIYDIKGLGSIYALYNFGSNAAYYYYNTISLDDQSTSSLAEAYGFYNTSLTAAVEIKNNIFSITRSGAGLKYAIYLAEDRISLFSIDYNDYYTSGHPTINTGFYQGNIITSLAAWRTATSFDANSIAVDPAFRDAANGNFIPASAAFADKGTPLPVTVDYNNITRSTTKPDMGAFEYNLAACNTSFNAGAAFSSVGAVTCVNKTVLLNLKNNDVGLGLTYQWESAASLTGTWTSMSAPLLAPPYTFTTGNNNLYYRAAVSCNGGTPIYSAPVQINVGGLFPAGAYTIDRTQPSDPAGTRNFNSFNDAAAALTCGIAGPVVFNVKTNTYNEQFKLGAIPNSSAINTVTFQSQSGNAADVELWFDAQSVAKNYTVQLDSASNIIFKNMTISGVNQSYSRTIDILNIASNDSVLNCVINAALPVPAYYSTFGIDQTTNAGIYAGTGLKGGGIVIKGNTFRKGAKGIYISGASTTIFSRNNIIENNVFDSVYHHSIFAQNTSGIKILNNTVQLNTAYSAASFNQGVYGIYMNNCDSAVQVIGNNVTLRKNTGYTYGIYMTGNNATATARGRVANNKVIGIDGLTSLVTGLYNSTASYQDVVNNEVSVSSAIAGTSNSVYAAAMYTSNATYTNYYNNSLLNTSPAAGIYNVALYVDHQYSSTGGFTNIYNNILANKGGGPAVFYNYTAEHIQPDYNLLYTTGTILVKKGPTGGSFNADYADITAWRNAFGTDMNSIVYDPAFTSTTDLQPLASSAGSWALQGRGMQLAGNNVDKNGNARSTTLTAGVPDLGAYEFFPSVIPPVLTAVPAAPAAGTKQVFLMGSDTVTTITWAPGFAVPATLQLRRYSGVLPAGLPAADQSLYYYVDADATGTGSFKYNVQQHFINPWLRTLPVKSYIKMGKTDAANVWSAGANSSIDSLRNIISDTAYTFLDKFTGLTNGILPTMPVYVTTPDSTNKGTRFWAPYGLNRDALLGNGQQFKFILAADVATDVTVSVNGTAYSKTYSIPAGGVITTDQIPKSGLYDARLREEGYSNRGILIESKAPIAATAFLDVAGYTNALLLPTGTYGKSYTTLGARQFSGYPDPSMGTSWVNVVADNDNTVVEITPSGNTKGGRLANVPFRVTLNRGDVYQILGAFIKMRTAAETGGLDNSYESADLTGTTVVAVPNSAGVCMPVGVFAGSGGTGIRCEANQNGADKYVYQQSYPDQAWGKHYLTAPLASNNSKNEHLFNIFRVMIREAGTVVKRNGTTMTGLIAGRYYEFTSRAPEYIEADKPVMVAQMMTYFNSCGNDEYSNPGSNESMFYLTPLGKGIKKTVFYRKGVAVGTSSNYITAIIPTAGVTSLRIDGGSTFDTTYLHPRKPGYTVVMKRWTAAEGVSVIESDSAFTAIVHMPSNVYGFVYNVGYTVPRVDFTNETIHNVNNTNPAPNTYTCANTPFRATVYLPVAAKTLTWKLSAVPGITPNTDVVQTSPVPVRTEEINFRDYYVYTLAQDLRISTPGTYKIPVSATYAATSAAACDNTVLDSIIVVVTAAPVIDYTVAYSGCVGAAANFTGIGTAGNGAVVDRWNWSFGDATTATVQNPVKTWAAPGSYNVTLAAIASDGCTGSVTKPIVVNALPTLTVVNNNQGICPNGSVTFQVSNPVAGVTYTWYNVATGGTALFTGATYTATNVPGATTFYVSARQNGCDIATRVPVTVFIIPAVAAPVVTVDSVGVRAVRFKWNAIANATGYQVSTDNGASWITPSSGATGLTHTVTGLNPSQTVSILVRGLGGCVQNVSAAVSATTLTDNVFIPNSFTPNSDGKNDLFMVYGNEIKELRLAIFNQWGQKLYETTTPGTGWDGKQGGKAQPTGVYIYVARIVLLSGEELNKKGSVNLIR